MAARGPGLEDSIRSVICTSDSLEDLTCRVQQAVGEYASPSDDLHISHAIAPDSKTEHMMFSALLLMRPVGTR